MKIIHTADIHLDSPLSQVKDSVKRRYELLAALKNIAEYAENNGVAAIIVAGDLFDDKFTTVQTINSVADIINGGNASWYILKGNHGDSVPYEKLAALCKKAYFFGEEFTYYNIGNITICGRELGINDAEHYRTLNLDSSRYNIVVLHGDIDDDAYGSIDRKTLSALPVNYVALGHRHSFSKFKFGRVPVCYSGVLEARGFDENAQTGFVELDTEADAFRFVPQFIRRVATVNIDVSDIVSDIALNAKILDAIQDESSKNYLNVVFSGTLSQGVHLDLVANEILQDKFFALRIENRTSVPMDLNALMQEVSLRGEFVKLAMQIDDEKFREEVLKTGLTALAGEEIV